MSDPMLIPPCNRRYECDAPTPEGMTLLSNLPRPRSGSGRGLDTAGDAAPASASKEELRQLDEESVDICFSQLSDLLDSAY